MFLLRIIVNKIELVFSRRRSDWWLLWKPVLALTVAAAAVVGGLSSYFTFREYERAIEYEEKTFEDVVSSLAYRVEAFDYPSVALVARSFINSSRARAIVIKEVSQIEIANIKYDGVSQQDRDKMEVRRFPLHSTLSGREGEVVGVAVFYLEPRAFWEDFTNVVLEAIGSFIAVFVVIIIILRLYIKKYVTEPIAYLSEAMERTRLTGEYAPVKVIGPSQLGKLAESYNTVQSDLQLSRAHLYHAKKMEAIGNLTSSVAHEFNNILAVILANVELIESTGSVGGRNGDRLKRIHGASQNAASIVEQLLSYSSKERGARVAVASVREALADLKDRTAPFMRDNVRVQLDIDKDAMVRVNLARFEAAIINLVKNACEALGDADGGSIWVSVTVGRNLSPVRGPAVSISVCDDGPGVPAALQDKLFEPFFTTKESRRGTGLGLWMVYSFAEVSGGAARYEPRPNGGSCFTITLPVVEHALTSNEPVKAADIDALTRKRILVLEDEVDVGRAYTEFLTGLNNSVTHVVSVEEAKAAIAAESFDIAICDYKLPDGNGLDFIQIFKAQAPTAIAMLVSGNFDVSRVDHALVDCVAGKPVSFIHLCESLARALGAAKPEATDVLELEPEEGARVKPLELADA